MKEDMCGIKIIHQDTVDEVNKKIVDENIIIEVSDFFKIFGDGTRLSIINALMHAKLCVCDIAVICNMSQSAISHQLRVLKDFNIVKFEKVGKVVYYELDDNHIKNIFEKGVEHIREQKI